MSAIGDKLFKEAVELSRVRAGTLEEKRTVLQKILDAIEDEPGESDLELDGSDDGSGLEPHRR